MNRSVKKTVITALIAASMLTFSSQAQAGLFSFLGDIVNAILNVPKIAVNVIQDFPSFLDSAVKMVDSMLTDMFGQSDNAANQQQVGSYKQFHQDATTTSSQNVNKTYAGTNNPYQTKLSMYKQGNQVCKTTTNSSGQKVTTCLPTNSATTAYNTKVYTPASQAAAVQYNTNAAGAGPAKPTFQTADPSAVNYTAAYQHQTANQSTSTLTNTHGTAGRTPTGKNGEGKSSSSFIEDAFAMFMTNPLFNQGITGFFVKPILGAGRMVLGLPHMISHASDTMDNLSTTTSGLNNQAANATQQTSTNQLHARAQAIQSGGPVEKNPYE